MIKARLNKSIIYDGNEFISGANMGAAFPDRFLLKYTLSAFSTRSDRDFLGARFELL